MILSDVFPEPRAEYNLIYRASCKPYDMRATSSSDVAASPRYSQYIPDGLDLWTWTEPSSLVLKMKSWYTDMDKCLESNVNMYQVYRPSDRGSTVICAQLGPSLEDRN